MVNKFILSSFLCVAAFFFLAGCTEKGPMEKAGERTDEIIDNVKEGKAPLHKAGAMEKAGEAIDDAVDSDNK